MSLITESYLRAKAQTTTGYYVEARLRSFSATLLETEQRSASKSASFDIFLSHASEDAILIKALRDELVEKGYSVYVDWIDDPQLDRSQVTSTTAALLRERMKQCKSLLFATSDASKKSVWMPWELGFMDAITDMRVAIIPIVRESEAGSEFKGQEYLGIYPYLDKTGANLYVHRNAAKYTGFDSWLRSKVNP